MDGNAWLALDSDTMPIYEYRCEGCAEKFEEYLHNPYGKNFVAGAIVMQAIGMLWITRIARVRF